MGRDYYKKAMINEELKQPVTKEYLGTFTEEVLLPAISTLMDEKLKPLEKRVDNIEAIMVTKTYLTETLAEKLADQTGDLIVLMRKEDHKLIALVEILKNRKVISDDDAQQILSLEPFPKTQ